jgi:hypothetical protein
MMYMGAVVTTARLTCGCDEPQSRAMQKRSFGDKRYSKF